LTYGPKAPADQQLDGERFYTSAQLLAARGFAVLLPSLPMPAILPDEGFEFAEALTPAINAALATGRCDPTRIGLWGHSYGGYAAVMAAAQTSRFRGVVASAGLYDLAGTVGTFGPNTRAMPHRILPVAANYAWAEEGQGRMGVPPWAAWSRYVGNSPVYIANQISTPLLITAADQDMSPMSQAEQLFSALFRQGKDAQLVTYWGEGHVVASPANLHDYYDRVTAFFTRTVSLKQVRLTGTFLEPDGPSSRASIAR
jgi:dipeptidyl aminopeptidase/acylaminoacyl peptidase